MIHFDKFVYFCRLQLESGDYDAHIPFLTHVRDVLDLPQAEATRLALLYMSYYNEGSAWYAFSHHDGYPCLQIPIDPQRRNIYSVQERWWHLKSVASKDWSRLHELPDWRSLLSLVGSVYGNGRWATYTTSELLMHMANLDVRPSSFEVMDSSGPKQGLEWLGLKPSEEAARSVHASLAAEDIHVQYSQLESLLCDWAGMNKGSFYAGRNIDRQQGRILKVERLSSPKHFNKLWEIRRLAFPRHTLGEAMGWEGIDKERKKVYKLTGKVLQPHEDR